MPHSPVGNGRIAAPSGLQKGDVLLFTPELPNGAQNTIVVAQEMVSSRVHASFTHVGLYMGNGDVYDATPWGGVALRHFNEVMPKPGWVRARRMMGITPLQQDAVCQQATQLHGNYALLQAFVDTVLLAATTRYASAVQLLTKQTPTPFHPKRAFYCSSLVQEAYVQGINVSLIAAGSPAALPCTLSAANGFAEVQIHF